MINYEKIALVSIAILIVVVLGFSYCEMFESPVTEHPVGPSFAASLGPNLKLGSFNTILSQNASGPIDAHCTALQPVIVSALHDIDQKLEAKGVYASGVFQVNQSSIDVLCHQDATITLSNTAGAKLLLVKRPSTRVAPAGAGADDIGTSIHIDATIVQPGTIPPTTPTTYGEELIPDRYLGIQ